MTWLKAKFPVLWSPRLWGIILTMALWYIQKKGIVIDQDLAESLTGTTGVATIVGISGWIIKKSKQ